MTLTPLQRRLLAAPAEPEDKLGYIHTVLAQCGMPRRRVGGDSYERTNGGASLRMKAGELWNPKTGEWQSFPLPYGTRPRLALIHISAEAVRTRSRVVEVGRSAREFLMRLGTDTNGREYTTFRNQMTALAACDMRLGFGGRTIMDAKPIAVFDAWPKGPEDQRSLWPGTVTLTEQFLASLLDAAVPLDLQAISKLKHSALALDVYAWLAHRLRRVTAPTGERISWLALLGQFGEYRDMNNFRRELLEALAVVKTVYPDAKFEQVRGGLRLLPSRPPVPELVVTGRSLPSG